MLEKVIRFDALEFPKVSKTKEGFLRGKSIVTRVGVFEYLDENGSIRKELRHPDDVFNPDSLSSIKMIPVTDGHPPVFIDSNNAVDFQAGYTGEEYEIIKDKHISVSVTVTHKSLIDKILLGEKPEISMGYETVLVKEDGVYDGEKYEFRQTNIRYNHLASVDRGRAGRDARFRFDNACINKIQNLTKVTKMDDLDIRLDIANTKISEQEAKIELLKNELHQFKLKTDALETGNAELRAKNESLLATVKPERIAEQVRDRCNILAIAEKQAGLNALEYMYHTDREIQIAAINAKEKLSNTFEGYDDLYIKGRFDACFKKTEDSKMTRNVFNAIKNHIDQIDTTESLIHRTVEQQRQKGII
jgi:hypothetical protein